MKKLIFGFITMLGITFGNAGDIYLDFAAEDQQFYRGLGRAKDAFSTTLSTEQAVGGFGVNASASLVADSDSESHFGVGLSRQVKLGSLNLLADGQFRYHQFEGALPTSQEVGVGGFLATEFADVGIHFWSDLEYDWEGIEVTVKKDLAVPSIKNLTLSPFITRSWFDAYDSLHAGVKATYALKDNTDVFVQGAYADNDIDVATFAVDEEIFWSAGLTFKF
jgi:predicted porin